MGKMIFAYWNLRGRGEIARMMFEYAGQEYEDKRYEITISGDGQINFPEWKEDKESLGLAFPNLPYLIDGEAKLTESWAIYKYLARKFGLYPKTEKGEYEAEMLAGVLAELQKSVGMTAYNPDAKNLVEKTREDLLPKLDRLNKFLSGRTYATGEEVTYIDFALFENMDVCRLMLQGVMDGFPSITSFLKEFESLDRISAYFKSDRYRKFPIYAPMASWGGKDHDDKDW